MKKNKRQPKQKLNTVNYQDLIISNPENQVFWKRAVSFLVTLCFWGVWVYLWTPLPAIINKLSQSGFSNFSMQPPPYIIVFFSLLAVLITWQLGWLNYNLIRFKNRGRRTEQSLLSNQELVQFFTVDNNKLDNWQQSKCLVIQHNDTGEIQEININDFISFIPPSLKNKAEEQPLQRYYIILFPSTANKALFIEIANQFVVIMKVLCSLFKIKFIKCQVARNYLSLIIDIPLDYDVDDMVSQLKAESDLVVKRKFPNKLDSKGIRGMFWGIEQLVTTERLTRNEIQQFFEEISLNNKPLQTQASPISEVSKKDKIVSKQLAPDYWKNNLREVIENKITKKKTQIDINDFFVCVPLPPEDHRFEGNYQRLFVIILPAEQQRLLFTEIGENFRDIMKILCSMLKIELVDCIIAKTHLTLTLDIPEGFAADEFVKQLKNASAAVIDKKYGSVTTGKEAFIFWSDKQLITVPELVDIEVKEFTSSIQN